MSKKFTYEFVKRKFKDCGCLLLENEYINTHVRMRYQCSCGNIGKITFNKFKNGQRCKLCRNRKLNEKFSFSQKEVELYFKNEGCELLSLYDNARNKLKYKCNCGNISSIAFYSFKNGNRCKSCGVKKMVKKNQLTHDYVYGYFKKNHCLLMDTYIKSNVAMQYTCSCGNIDKINWNNFKRGQRCKRCRVQKISGSNNYQWIADRELKKSNDSLKHRCYKLLKIVLKSTNVNKHGKTEEMLGYTIEEFKNHIFNHKNWIYLKNKKWHIDHIYPIKAFLDYGIKDIKLINGLDNLQPLYYKDNLLKNAKYDINAFENYIQLKGYSIFELL